MLAAGISIPAYGQYPGHIDPNKGTAAPTLRATAVLEYTGDLTKPTAARLIPLAVWDGERYQPGGLYLAQPMPLAVESGTQYELEEAGIPKGLFDVKAAANVSGSWIAIGSYQKPPAPRVAKLKPSKTLPQVVREVDADDGKPHFAHRPADSGGSSSGGTSSGSSGSGSSGGSASKTAPANAPEVDPDRPTLHRRTDSSTGENSGDASSSGSAGSGSAAKSSSAPDVDPDRPTLHRHTPANANDNGAPVSATMDVDPDRPRLQRGRPLDLESLDVPSNVEVAKLAGHPQNLEQIVAVSDAKKREPHSFVYSWTDPEDAKKMQAALEVIAGNLLAGKALKPEIGGQAGSTAKNTKTAAATARTGSAKTGTAGRAGHKAASAPALPALADEQFKAYELSFGGGATLVFSARTAGAGDQVKYVTIIAQPDFNGTPQVILKQVTSEGELDVTPRMVLVDALDTDADNRAELIFELAGKTDRQYAIYRVADRSVEQVFTTGG